ncbi:MAG: hypothetical protein JWO80_1509, partial [Bryobacterales bacterium]|nr:hypothetical protein [Bryobacterales bacterium]
MLGDHSRYEVRLNSDGTLAWILADPDGQLHIWDLSSNDHPKVLTQSLGQVTAFATTGDGRTAVCKVSENTIAICHLDELLVRYVDGVLISKNVMTLSGDGRRLFYFDQSELCVWDVEKSCELKRLSCTREMMFVASSHDGERLAFVHGSDRQVPLHSVYAVAIWDPDTMDDARIAWEELYDITCLQLAGDGQRAAVTTKWGRLVVVELGRVQMRREYRSSVTGHVGDDRILHFAISANGKLALSGGVSVSSVTLWDLDAVSDSDSSKDLLAIALSQDEKRAALLQRDGTLVVLSLEGSTAIWTMPRPMEDVWASSLVLSEDGLFGIAFGIGDRSFALWDLAGGGPPIRIKPRLEDFSEHDQWEIRQHLIEVVQMIYKPYRHICVFASNNKCFLMKVSDSPLQVWRGEGTDWSFIDLEESQEITAMIFLDEDGEWAVSGQMDGALLLWRLTEHKAIRPIGRVNGTVTDLKLVPDIDGELSLLAATTLNGDVVLWKMAGGDWWLKQLGEHESADHVFSGNGRYMFSISRSALHEAPTAYLWDLTGENRIPFTTIDFTTLTQGSPVRPSLNYDGTRLALTKAQELVV